MSCNIPSPETPMEYLPPRYFKRISGAAAAEARAGCLLRATLRYPTGRISSLGKRNEAHPDSSAPHPRRGHVKRPRAINEEERRATHARISIQS